MQLSSSSFLQVFYLHKDFQQFWRITIDPQSKRITEEYGNLLPNRQEDKVQTKMTCIPQKDRVSSLGQTMINQKLNEGYRHFTGEDLSESFAESGLRSRASFSNRMSGSLKRRPTEPLVREDLKHPIKRLDSQSDGDFSEASSFVPEKEGLGAKLLGFFKGIVSGNKKDEYESENESIVEPPRDGELFYDTHSLKLQAFIQTRARDLGLKCDVFPNQVRVSGEPAKLQTLHDLVLVEEERSADEGEREFILSPLLKTQTQLLIKRAEELGLMISFQIDKVCIQGSSRSREEFVLYLLELEQHNQHVQYRPSERSSFSSVINPMEEEQKIPSKVLEEIESLKSTIQELKMKADFGPLAESRDILPKVEYPRSPISNFQDNFLEAGKKIFSEGKEMFGNLIKKASMKEAEQPPPNLEQINGQYIQKEIRQSSFLRLKEEEVQKKAKELDLILENAFGSFHVLGYEKIIETFLTYLNDLEVESRKQLHPPNWNFQDPREFAQIVVPPLSQEFKDVTASFTTWMPNFTIVSLERIQNLKLMDGFITFVQRTQEAFPKEKLSRRLLYYGTGTLSPSVIYKDSDVGFDVRLASVGFNQKLKFEVNPGMCHQRNPHKTSNGNYQLLIADVLVGKVKVGNPGSFPKPPEGTHSVSESNDAFTIYNNFQSYPLYLIEYRPTSVNTSSMFPRNNMDYISDYY